jgi:beta-galactosidase
MLPGVGSVRPWADPGVVALNRLPMRAPSTAFPTAADARKNSHVHDGDASPWRRSLNGKWNFRLYDSPESIPANAVVKSPSKSWTRVTVPGNWTMQDTGDLPQYTNVQMPFDGPPPALPEKNPTGVYRRPFKVPASWDGRQIVLHIGGAESTHILYVNGQWVGYGTDSRLASEYDITDFVERGDNDIAIVVSKWSAQSYVEDQDQWWMGGLHREVFVEARGATHIANVICNAAYNHIEGSGTLDVTAVVGGFTAPSKGWKVKTRVESLSGKLLAKTSTLKVPHAYYLPMRFFGHRVDATFMLADIEPWSAEMPTRYRVICELIDPDGQVAEAHAQIIGFRSIVVSGNELLINGQPAWIFGVNRHDHHPARGKALTLDDMRADLLAMRRHNITAVRCSHYPNDPRLLDLCDEIGLYVIDEANLEAHQYNTSLCNDPAWRSTWLARAARMVERDRNHASIIMWSLGNEAGYGRNHDAQAGWIRHADPSRPLHYEPASFHDGWLDGGRHASDVVCPMYPTHEDTAAYAGDRPFIMCEYSHAMGNSNGSLADYWDTITSTPGLQGGFIWEWKDHGLLTTLPSGKKGFAYGGQFGEPIHDGNFVADGLMSADLVAHPVIQEVEWVYRPVTVEKKGAKLVVTNRRSFIDLSDLTAEWELNVGGVVTASGDLEVPPVAPHSSIKIALPCALPAGPDAHLIITWTQRAATAWAPAGKIVACDQMQLRPPKSVPIPKATNSGVRSAVGRLLAAPVELSIFRAPTDNDGYKLMPEMTKRHGIGGKALTSWQERGIDRKRAESFVGHDHRVDVLDDGSEAHHHVVEVPEALSDLGRIGVSFQLKAGFDQLRWFGRGARENYPDRNRGAMVGTWEAGVDAEPYLVPQEFGLRTDCRWFEFINSSTGAVVRLDVLRPTSLHISATRFTAADLYAAVHETDLAPRKTLVVHADVAHRGLGTASCGPDVLHQYEIPTGRHTFSYRLSTK